jgi:hypothetical protein
LVFRSSSWVVGVIRHTGTAVGRAVSGGGDYQQLASWVCLSLRHCENITWQDGFLCMQAS